MARRVVTVFGGSGFIGRHLVQRLVRDGWVVRVVVRDPVDADRLKPMGGIGQVVVLKADITDAAAVRAAVEGAQAVVNLVGILYERGRRTFQRIHVEGAANVATAAKDAGVARLVHLSALGADKDSASAYARSKAEGEAAVAQAFGGATILRPSVVFGADDDFFNRFARMALLPIPLPVFTRDGLRVVCTGGLSAHLDLFGGGGPVFQPVWVGDVAEAAVRAIEDPELAGRVYELGGTKRYSLKEVFELILAQTNHCRMLVPVPMWVAKWLGFWMQFWPKPPLTPDQVALMRQDNVVRGGKPGLAKLGITPRAVEDEVPLYLARYRRHSGA